MAKVLNPLNSVEARGRVAGLIYNTWRGISYVKAFSSPNQPGTAIQQAAKQLLASLAAAWQSVSAANRTLWETYAQNNLQSDWTGNPKRLTAMNWFIRCNALCTRLGVANLSAPPSDPAPEASADAAIANNAGDIEISWTDPTDANLHFEVRHVGPLSATRDGRFEMSRFLAFQACDKVSPIDLIASAPSGKHVFFLRVCDEDTGLTSQWSKHEVTIA